MVDSIQATSSIPLPKYQTVDGTKDPLPIDSPKEILKSDDARSEQTEATKKDNFEDYLNQSSITVAEQNAKSLSFDAVRDIEDKSVYHHPLEKNAP